MPEWSLKPKDINRCYCITPVEDCISARSSIWDLLACTPLLKSIENECEIYLQLDSEISLKPKRVAFECHLNEYFCWLPKKDVFKSLSNEMSVDLWNIIMRFLILLIETCSKVHDFHTGFLRILMEDLKRQMTLRVDGKKIRLQDEIILKFLPLMQCFLLCVVDRYWIKPNTKINIVWESGLFEFTSCFQTKKPVHFMNKCWNVDR